MARSCHKPLRGGAAWKRISGETVAEEKPPERRGRGKTGQDADVVTALRLILKLLWHPSKHMYYRSSEPVSRLTSGKIDPPAAKYGTTWCVPQNK